MRQRILAALLLLCALSVAPAVSWAQTGTPAQTVATCGTPNNAPVVGGYYSLTMNPASQLCIAGNITANPSVIDATSTDASGTVTAGGTYQLVIASNASRKGCLIQNPVSASETLNVRIGATTVYSLAAGAALSCSAGGGVIVSDNVYVTGTTTGHAFSANYQ